MDKRLNKLGDYLLKNYPDIKWAILTAPDDVIQNFGDGFFLAGFYGDKKKEYFILTEDRHAKKWGDVIAAELTGSVEEEEDAAKW